MENEEKKVKPKKTTAPKKTTSTRKTATKKVEKKEDVASVKKTTVKKTVTKKAEPKEKVAVKKETPTKTTVKKPATKKVESKEIVKEVVTKPKVEVTPEVKEEKKVIANEIKEEKISKKELMLIRKKRYIVEGIILAVVALIALILLCNKTFLSVNYKDENVNISIPRFSYFVKNEDNEIKFMTLRKSKYLKDYYNEYLEGFVFYSCAEGERTFYYNEQTKTLIKEIEIEKKFAIKTIEIEYDTRTPEEVCGLR